MSRVVRPRRAQVVIEVVMLGVHLPWVDVRRFKFAVNCVMRRVERIWGNTEMRRDVEPPSMGRVVPVSRPRRGRDVHRVFPPPHAATTGWDA